jgi:hypothetical protein
MPGHLLSQRPPAPPWSPGTAARPPSTRPSRPAPCPAAGPPARHRPIAGQPGNPPIYGAPLKCPSFACRSASCLPAAHRQATSPNQPTRPNPRCLMRGPIIESWCLGVAPLWRRSGQATMTLFKIGLGAERAGLYTRCNESPWVRLCAPSPWCANSFRTRHSERRALHALSSTLKARPGNRALSIQGSVQERRLGQSRLCTHRPSTRADPP